MKIDFHVKLGLAIIAVFGLVLFVFTAYRPVCIKIHAFRLSSQNMETRDDAAESLKDFGQRGVDSLTAFLKERYLIADAGERIWIVEKMCSLGDEARSLMKAIFIRRIRKDQALVSDGNFMMGNDKGYADERPVHNETISRFAIDKYEVTNEKYFTYECIAGTAGNYKTWVAKDTFRGYGSDYPMVNVSWDDADKYAGFLGMRLPDEAEWEYACLACAGGDFCFSENAESLGKYAWFMVNSGNRTHPVGKKKPNAWGLYDMHGNAWEWCLDWYNMWSYNIKSQSSPSQPSGGPGKVLRGGSWGRSAVYCRSSHRYFAAPGTRDPMYGFRVCRPIPYIQNNN
jgi:formylglycine-generating enzyme required for sulfatase activity